jgi:hypothetical protein
MQIEDGEIFASINQKDGMLILRNTTALPCYDDWKRR